MICVSVELYERIGINTMHDFIMGTSPAQKQAIQKLEERADGGDVDAMYKLGMAHVVGCVYNPERGVTILKAASNAGHVESQRQLARFLYSFDEVRPDWPQSLELASELADRGNLEMQLLAATLYQSGGRGIKRDLEKSLTLAKGAAERGHAPANVFVGDMYKHGMGVERDSSRALEWYQKGHDAGDANAASKIHEVGGKVVTAGAPLDAFYGSKGYSASPEESSVSVATHTVSAPRM